MAQCQACGDFHRVTAADMILIIDAFQRGELHTTRGGNLCLLEAFTPENVADIVARYPKLKMFAGDAG